MSAHTHYRLAQVEQQLLDIQAGKAEYRKTHKAAKAINCMLVAALIYFSGGALWANTLAIPVWFYCTNLIAYGLESLLGYKHRHEVI